MEEKRGLLGFDGADEHTVALTAGTDATCKEKINWRTDAKEWYYPVLRGREG